MKPFSAQKPPPPPGDGGGNDATMPNAIGAENSHRVNWHHSTIGAILRSLDTDAIQGLSDTEARRRLGVIGPNELPEAETRGIGRIAWEQIATTMVILLVVAGLISLALQDFSDAIAIFAIVLLNAAFGFGQEYRAEKAIQALRRLAAPTVTVRRDGVLATRAARELVPGDIVLLEAGGIVSADCRLLETASLQLNEAALTGESAPVDKSPVRLPDATVPLAERSNMAYLGTSVNAGRGTAVVTATGAQTELGRIAEMLGKVEHEQTPLQRRLDGLSRSLALFSLILVGVIFCLGLIRGEPLTLMFLTAVSMAVAAVPEGLPAVVTVALALGAQRMLRRRALIRRLPAAETLGSVTVICSDKTGTLTENRMTVTALEADGQRHERIDGHLPPAIPAMTLLLAAGALCNDSQPGASQGGGEATLGDPMEVALATTAGAAGLQKPELEVAFPRVTEIPFESKRKRMTTVHRVASGLPSIVAAAWPPMPPAWCIAFMKGGVESVLSVCDRQWVAGREELLDADARAHIRESGERLADTGQRVLGFAFRLVSEGEDPALLERNLVFIGMMGLSDPTRSEAKAAVRTCSAAGIRPIMITGDHHLTARHVARELGIEGRVATGAELATLSAARLGKVVEEVSIYARVLPEHKFRIVEALQAHGHVVSMTGDGVNDAPALKQADIGVSMGVTGTDVSKQASDMVLLDDNFATIVAAVEEGRTIYDNIRKFIRYVLAGNTGEMLVMLLGPLCGLPLPLLPLQILWINLASDGLNGLALSVEPPERDTMTRPPRDPNESIFAQGMVRHILGVGTLLGILSLAAGLYYWNHHNAAWQTAVFLVVAFGQIFQTLAARSWRDSFFQRGLWTNSAVLGAIAVTSAGTLAVVYLPSLQSIFGTVALPFPDLVAILGLSTMVFWGAEFEKFLCRRKR